MSVLVAGVDRMRIADLTKLQRKTGKTYDPARAIARWETDGGAPEGGRPLKHAAILPKPGGSDPLRKNTKVNGGN